MNKFIKRDGQTATKIFDNRSVASDYRTLLPILKKGLRVLDVGCGTGTIAKGIAEIVGETGFVVGIDNTEAFIQSGKESYGHISQLELIHADLFQYQPTEKFDLIVSSRTLQWLSNPKDAIKKIKTLLKPGGQLSVLDYNHTALEWNPSPPQSMLNFYACFLKWRSDAGMNNAIAEDLPTYFEEAGFQSVTVFDSSETYTKGQGDFESKVGIWSKVAGSTQMVEEGYISDENRLKAIEEYNLWVNTEALKMTMELKEIRGIN